MNQNLKMQAKSIMLTCCFIVISVLSVSAISLEGTVRDVLGNPVPNATLQISGTDEIISTNETGHFDFSNDAKVIDLIVSAKGYRNKFLVFKNSTGNITVVLQKTGSPKNINTLWGEVDANRFNGSVIQLFGDDLDEVATSSVSNALTGRAAGLITVQDGIKPGYDAADMYIRGRSGNLIYIDGRRGSLENVNMKDVESITILKDASASSIYGTRGANGVTLITTKKGIESAAQVTFSSEFTWNQFNRIPQSLGAFAYANAYNAAAFNSGYTDAVYSEDDIALYGNGNSPLSHPNVNWAGSLLREGYLVNQNHLSVRGGTNNVKYYMSMGYNHGDGMLIVDEADELNYSTNTEYEHYNLVSNLEFKPTTTTLINVRMNGGMKDNNYPSNPSNFTDKAYSAIYQSIISLPPNVYPKYIPDNGNYIDQTGNKVTDERGKIVSWNRKRTNPWAQINRNGYTKTFLMYGMVQSDITQNLSAITPGLKAKGNIYFTITSDEDLDRRVGFSSYEYLATDSLFASEAWNNDEMNNVLIPRSTQRRISWDIQLAYDREFGKSKVSSVFNWNRYENSNDITVPARYESYSLYGGYAFNNKYSLDATLAYGGIYKYSPEYKYRFYPSISAGWRISNESFFESLKPMISYAKLRASYGKTDVGGGAAFQYLINLTQSGGRYYTGNTMAGVAGIYEELTPNPNIRGGIANQFTTGLDLSFADNRLDLSVEYFTDHRKELPLSPNASYSSIYGILNVPALNVGENITRGFDAFASFHDKVGDFSYFATASFTLQKNEIISIDENLQPYEWMYKKGNASGDRFGLVADGLYRSAAELEAAIALPNFAEVQVGDIRYQDLNEDGVIDKTYDSKWIGHGKIPKMFYGFELGMSYKGFDVSALLQGASMVTRNLGGIIQNPFNDNTVYEFQMDSWSEDNPNASLPIHTITPSLNNNTGSSFWVKDASYLRLKNLQIGYTLPSSLVARTPFNSLRIYVSGYNLMVWDTIEIIDPETSGGGEQIAAPGSYCVGLKISF